MIVTAPEEQARRERWLRRRDYQEALDAALTPVSDAPAQRVRAAWEPIRQFTQEGADVGEQNEAESRKGQRIN